MTGAPDPPTPIGGSCGSQRARPACLRTLELTLWLCGSLTLAWVGWAWVDGRLYQARQERLLEEAVAVASAAPAVASGESGARREGAADRAPVPAREGPATQAAGESPPPPLAPARAVGGDGSGSRRARQSAAAEPPARLAVPRLGMAVMVAPGVDSGTLRRAAGHIPGTAPLGSSGNIGLAGHRDSFFRPLRDIRPGDEVVLTTPSAVATYRVEWSEVVTPAAVEVLRPTPYPALTMVTCYPFAFVGDAPDRLVVRARLVASRARG